MNKFRTRCFAVNTFQNKSSKLVSLCVQKEALKPWPILLAAFQRISCPLISLDLGSGLFVSWHETNPLELTRF